MNNLWLVVLLLTYSLASLGHAQSLLPQDDPGRIEERLPQALLNTTGPSNVSLPFLDGLMELENVKIEEGGARFRVDEIVITGSTVYDDAVLQEQISNAIGASISLYDLHQAVANITNLYRKEGYAFSKAFIPPQTIENNTVAISVIEGYVEDVEFRGIEVPDYSPIHRYAERLSEYRPLKQAELERYVLLINDLSGVQAKVIADPVNGNPGAIKVVFLLDKSSHSVGFILNNRGSDAIGPTQMVASYQANDALGLGEQTRFVHLRTPVDNELSYISASQTWPIGSEGAKLSYHLRRSEAEPGEAATVFDTTSQSNTLAVDLYYPWVRSRKENFSTLLAFDMRNSATESFDQEIIDDHTRYLRAQADYQRVHHRGVTDASVRFSYGLDVFDATTGNNIMAGRLGGSSDVNIWNADISRRQVLSENWSLTLQATAQWAMGTVLSAELFGIGGSEYGRAFDFSQVTGDSGYAALAQLTYQLPDFDEKFDNLAVYGFVDGGQVFDETNQFGSDWQEIASGGVGLDVAAFDNWYSKLEITRPIQIQGNVDQTINAFATVGFQMNF